MRGFGRTRPTTEPYWNAGDVVALLDMKVNRYGSDLKVLTRGAASLRSMVKCERCGGENLSLVEDLPDGRKPVRCDNCGHEWGRGQPTRQRRPEPETPASKRAPR